MKAFVFIVVMLLCFFQNGFSQEHGSGKIGFYLAYTPVFPERYLGLNFGVQYRDVGGVFFQYNREKDKTYQSYYGGFSARIPSERAEVYFIGGMGRTAYRIGQDQNTYMIGVMQVMKSGFLFKGGHTWNPNGQMLIGVGFMVKVL